MPEYILESRAKSPSGFQSYYRALGTPNPETGAVPNANVGTYHQFAKYTPTFTNEQGPNYADDSGQTGLHPEYLTKRYRSLLDEPDIADNPEKMDAMRALGVLRGYPSHGKTMDWAVEQARTNPHITPEHLFYESKPAKTYINGMYSDPSMNAAGINLLGIAYDEGNRAPFVADSSLTKFSSKLTQNAIKRGLPVSAHSGNPSAESTAGDYEEQRQLRHTMSSEYADVIRRKGAPIPDTSVIRGKEAVREILGRKRNPKPVTAKGLSDQFLPGMEGFV
jgi:hypothetical protein